MSRELTFDEDVNKFRTNMQLNLIPTISSRWGLLSIYQEPIRLQFWLFLLTTLMHSNRLAHSLHWLLKSYWLHAHFGMYAGSSIDSKLCYISPVYAQTRSSSIISKIPQSKLSPFNLQFPWSIGCVSLTFTYKDFDYLEIRVNNSICVYCCVCSGDSEVFLNYELERAGLFVIPIEIYLGIHLWPKISSVLHRFSLRPAAGVRRISW